MCSLRKILASIKQQIEIWEEYLADPAEWTTYVSGFKEGNRVILQNLDTRTYNKHIPLREGGIATVIEKPNLDFPEDAVQITIDGGTGAIDVHCLRRVE